MKKITIAVIEDFIKKNEIAFFSTQRSLCIPIINRMYQKMVNGIKFDDIKICDDLVINGHHRYLSSLLSKTDIGKVQTHKTSATKKYAWQAVQFVDADWDTESKIHKFNTEDAEFNNVPIEKLIEMPK